MTAKTRTPSPAGRQALESALQPTTAVRALPWVVASLAVGVTTLLFGMSFLAEPRSLLGLLLVLSALLVIVVGVLGFLGARGLVAADTASRLARHADPSSGAASMAYFENACRQVQTSGQPFGLVVIRLSGAMNAPFAEDSPEEATVLQWAASQARGGTRDTDLVGRLPGLRLGVLLRGPLNKETAGIVLDRLKERLDPQSPQLRRDQKVQVRIGVAVGKATGPLTSLLSEAAASQVHVRGMPTSPKSTSTDAQPLKSVTDAPPMTEASDT